MIYIISGTNRKNSRSIEVSKVAQSVFKKNSVDTEIIDLAELPFEELLKINYSKELPPAFQQVVQKLNKADGLYIVTPEYNGSMPGALKYFIDHFSYPETFEHRPVAFTGIGFRWGGLRPVEHLQQIFNYRNAYIFPQRVFISITGSVFKDGGFEDVAIQGLMEKQIAGYIKFLNALKSQGLDANSMNKKS